MKRTWQIVPFAVCLFLSVWPAHADAIQWQAVQGQVRITDTAVQFSYMQGRAEATVAVEPGATVVFRITVHNTQTNTIGWSGETADRWSVALDSTSISGDQIGVFPVELSTISDGQVVVSLSGIDVGYWGGWYGPLMSDWSLSIVASAVGATSTLPGATSTLPIETTTTSTTTEPTTTWVSTTTSTTTTTIATTTAPIAPVPVTTLAPTTTVISVPAATSTSTSTTAPATTSTSTSTTAPATTTTSTSTTAPATTTTAPTDLVVQPANDAPIDERRRFEEQTNIFDGTHDDYIPVGSTITVAQRRAVVAATMVASPIVYTPGRKRR